VAERGVATLAPLAWRSARVELAAQVAAEPRLALADEGRFEVESSSSVAFCAKIFVYTSLTNPSSLEPVALLHCGLRL
jgi:hypothetical protein